MGIKYTDEPIAGIDVSMWNDDPSTTTSIDFSKAVEQGSKFVAIRMTYGVTTDRAFVSSRNSSKGKLLRFYYAYLDYYSHWMYSNCVGYGKSDADWGKMQADAQYALYKQDNDNTIVFVDVEKASMAPTIESDIYRVRRVLQGNLLRLDELTGKYNGLYIPLSYIKLFLAFKDRPLWLPWYNEYQNPASVIKAARDAGWTGKVLIWQYASDGDSNDDGIPDGKAFGMEETFLDFNFWIAGEEEFKNAGNVTINIPSTPTSTSPVTKLHEIGKAMVHGQNIRQTPDLSGKVVGTLTGNSHVEILSYAKDSKNNPWLRIGYNQWVIQSLGTKIYVQRVTT